jgi:hypothetical protein
LRLFARQFVSLNFRIKGYCECLGFKGLCLVQLIWFYSFEQSCFFLKKIVLQRKIGRAAAGRHGRR